MQRGNRVGAGGEAAGVAGGLAAVDLQCEIAQRVGGQQGLVDRRFAGCVGSAGRSGPSSGTAPRRSISGRLSAKYWIPSQKAGRVSGVDSIWALMATLSQYEIVSRHAKRWTY